MPSQFLRKLKSYTAIPLLFSIALIHINTSQADANELANLAIEKTVETTANSLLNISVSAQNDEINSPSDLLVIAGTEAAKTSVELMLSKVLSGLVERGILETSSTRLLDRVVTETNKRVQQILSTQTAGQNAIKKGPNSLASGLLVGLFLDVSSEVTKEVLTSEGHPTAGILASYGIQQGKVVYAAKTSGIMGAVVAQSMLTGSQVTEAFKLAAEFDDLKDDANQSAAVAAALDQMLDLRTEYKTAPPSEKQRIEQEIRENLTETLVYDPGLLSSERPIPGAQQLIGSQILAMRQADSNKGQAAEALYNRIENAHPDQAAAYRELALDFIKGNFYDPARWGIQESAVNPAKSQRDKMEDAFDRLETRTRLNVERLRSLTEEARSEGGIGNLSEEKQTLMVNLAKAIDSNMDNFGPQEVLRRITTSINDYAEKYGVEPIDFSVPPREQEVIANDTEEPSSTEVDQSDQVDATLPSNEPREEDNAAEQASILAEQQRQRELAQQQEEQRQADLSDAVDERRDLEQSRDETEAKLQEARNLVTVLRFNEAEKAQNELRDIAFEIQSLRDRKQASVGFDALEVRQRQVVRDLQRLRTVRLFRRQVINLDAITPSQRRVLNRYAADFGIVARNGQQPWQILLLTRSRLERLRNNELRSIVDRLNAIEAAGIYTDADERRFQQLVRREEELERRLDSLDNRLRIAEANVDRLNGQLSNIDQDIAANDVRISDLRRDGDIIDFNNYNVREFAQTDWENFSIFDDYEQIGDPPEQEADTDLAEDTSIQIGNAVSDTNTSGTVTLPNGDVITVTTTTTDNSGVTPPSSNLMGHVGAVSANNSGTQPVSKTALGISQVTGSDAVISFSVPNSSGEKISTPITASNANSGDYEHLKWGRYSGTPINYYSTAFSQNFPLESVHWVYGEATPITAMTSRTGTASWSGNIYGDFAAEGQALRVGAITGDLSFTVNFGNNDVTGTGEFRLDGSVWDSFNVSGDFTTGQTSGGVSFAGIETNLSGATGTGGGELEGTFFGSTGSEFGGSYWYLGSGGATSGIVTTKEGNTPTPTPSTNWDGTATYIYARDDGNGGTHPSSGTIGITDVNSGKTQLTFRQDDSKPINPGTLNVNSSNFSRFSYLGMGAWGEGVSYVVSDDGSRPVQFGHWVAYDATKGRPQTGTATYYGRLNGDYYEPDTDLTRHQAVTGSVELTANFGTSSISGELEVAVNGSHWTTATFNENILTFGDRHGFEGELNGVGYENTDIRAFFAGPNAEEIGGRFRINSEPTYRNNGTVDGVFGASQMGAPNLSFSSTLRASVSTQDLYQNISDQPADIDKIPTQANSLATITLPSFVGGGGTISTTQVLGSGGFDYTSWGRWGANVDTPSSHRDGGFWVAGNMTPASTVQNMTGTATYNGGMIGSYVHNATRVEATGNIQLTADFSNQSISGNMQFEHTDIHGTQRSNIAQLSAPISSEGTFFQKEDNYGFHGNFFGPKAEEVGGAAWMNTNEGSYNGVFRAAQ